MHAFFNDRPRDGVQRLWLRFNKRANRLVALGHPRAFVQQGCHGAKRRQIDLDRRAAQRLQMGNRLGKQRRAVWVAVELQVSWTRHAEPKTAGRTKIVAVRLQIARISIQRVFALRRAQHGARIGCSERKH